MVLLWNRGQVYLMALIRHPVWCETVVGGKPQHLEAACLCSRMLFRTRESARELSGACLCQRQDPSPQTAVKVSVLAMFFGVWIPALDLHPCSISVGWLWSDQWYSRCRVNLALMLALTLQDRRPWLWPQSKSVPRYTCNWW